MKASKGKFAMVTVSTMLSCLIASFAASSVGLPSIIISKASEVLGFGALEIGPVSSFIVLPVTLATLFLIYRFSSTAIKNWEAPARVSEVELAENYLENNLYALTAEQLKLLLKKQPDPIASEYISNWEDQLTEPPKPSETKDLLRDLFKMCKREAQILDEGWRSEGDFWSGEIYGVHNDDTRKLVAFVFDSPPTDADLSIRLKSIKEELKTDHDIKYYALYLSEEGVIDISGVKRIQDTNIEVLSSRTMILQGLDLKGYARELLKTYNNTKVGGTKTTLANSFVDLKIEKSDIDGTQISLSEKLDNWSQSDSEAHLVVTGEYGQGKSTALLKFCCDWAQRFLEDDGIVERIPLLIELRGKSPSEVDPLGFLSTWCSRYRLLPEQVMNLIKAGDAIVIFEGFDELKHSGRAFDRHQHFNALWRFAYPGTKLIFTGRPNFFLDQVEANRTLRKNDAMGIVGGAYTEVWSLLKLDREQIEMACRGYDDNVRTGLINSIDSNEDFFDIVSRPSMLPVVATIWNDIEVLQENGIPLTGAVLIERYIQAVFSRKEVELEKDRVRFDAPSGSRYLVLPKHVRELLTICVAWRMSGVGAKNTISRAEITAMVRDVYDTLFLVTKAGNISPSIIKGMLEFEKRHAESSQADRIEAVVSEICSAGLLVPDPAGGSSNLRFPHKQFYDFLISKAICIVQSEHSKTCSNIIYSSSNINNIFIRLIRESNSIDYLVECNGPNLSILFNNADFITYSFVLYLTNITNSSLERAKKTLPTKSFNLLKSRLKKPTTGEVNLNEYKKPDLVLTMLKKTRETTVFSLLPALSISIFIAVFLINYSIDPINSLLYKEIMKITLFSLLIALTLSIMALITIDGTKLITLYHYIITQWEKCNQEAETYSEVLSLARRSLAKRKIQFPTKSVRFNTDFSQFLYPSKEFGDNQNY